MPRRQQRYVSFKQVTPWPWHVEIIVGVSVVGEREGQRDKDRQTDRQTDRQMRQTDKERIRDRQTD